MGYLQRMKTIIKEELKLLYNELVDAHRQYLEAYGVVLPKLLGKKGYIRDAVILCILYKFIQEAVSKRDLTLMLASILNVESNDVQQARHLGRQKGWYILSGSRGDILPKGFNVDIGSSDYCLYSITMPYPTAILKHRVKSNMNFNELKSLYYNRCATCGSIENLPNLKNQAITTKLQQSHMNPSKPLIQGNIIPQCSECNQAYKDEYVFANNGRIIDINRSSSRWSNGNKVQ